MGIRHGFGDDWIRIGGLKGFVDGIMGNSSARFYEPYVTSGKLGEWRTMMNPPGNMERLLFIADSSGTLAAGPRHRRLCDRHAARRCTRRSCGPTVRGSGDGA